VSFHDPSASHVCALGIAGLHRFEAGVHTPPQPVSAQANVQDVPLSHVPSSLQVENVLVSHFVMPGRHVPTQAPFTHRAGQVSSF
jgi:hypothetical protein